MYVQGYLQGSENGRVVTIVLISWHLKVHSLSRVVVPATLDSISVNAHFTRFLSKLETVKKNVLKIVLIIVNINKDENKSLISDQFSLKNDFPPFLGELFCGVKTITNHFLREKWFEMSDLFSSLLIFTIIGTILGAFFCCF